MQLLPLRQSPRWGLAVITLLGLLVLARYAQAQTYSTGSQVNSGILYYAGDFTNAAGASFSSTGSSAASSYAGSTYTNNGTYAASTGATDQFVGPAGGAGLQTLAGSTAPTFYNLTLANGGSSPFSLTNVVGADVTNTLTFSNGITTTTSAVAGALRLGSAATVSGTFSTARYVDGYVGKAGLNSFTYPLGATNQRGGNTTAVGAAVYAPITVSNPGGTTLRYLATLPPATTVFAAQSATLQLKTVSAHEYYAVSVGTVPTGTTLTIPYGNFDSSATGSPYVSDPNTLTIAGYDGTRWINLSATASNSVNLTAKTVTVTLPQALSTSYSALALASTSVANPLPVTLVSFSAARQGADGLLRWRTASEANSAFFELQASRDGAVWQGLTTLAAAGTTTTPQAYQFLDPVLARYGVAVIYYRLREVDLDGSAHFSAVVTLNSEAGGWQVAAYPNPFASGLTAELRTLEAGPVTLTLVDELGRFVFQRQVAGTPGNQVVVLDEARTLATGTYILLVRQNNHLGTVRLQRE